MGGESLHRFQICQTELKYLDKLKCYRILSDSGVHPPGGVADGWMEMGVGMGVWGCVPCMYARTCMHTHAWHALHMHVKQELRHRDASMLSGHIAILYMCVCVCSACACVCVRVGNTPHAPRYPQTPPHPPAPSPEPQGAQNTKISITLETNQDNSILFEDSLPLNIPELI